MKTRGNVTITQTRILLAFPHALRTENNLEVSDQRSVRSTSSSTNIILNTVPREYSHQRKEVRHGKTNNKARLTRDSQNCLAFLDF